MKIVIDPGHSGSFEPGACAGDLRECDITLAYAYCLRTELEEAGHEVLMTRKGEIQTDGLSFRVEMANEWGADLFISIHANSANNTAANGTEVYYCEKSNAGYHLACCVLWPLVAAFDTHNRGVKPARFTVLFETDMPAILVELAFLSNDADQMLMADEAKMVLGAKAMAAGISDYITKHINS